MILIVIFVVEVLSFTVIFVSICVISPKSYNNVCLLKIRLRIIYILAVKFVFSLSH